MNNKQKKDVEGILFIIIIRFIVGFMIILLSTIGILILAICGIESWKFIQEHGLITYLLGSITLCLFCILCYRIGILSERLDERGMK